MLSRLPFCARVRTFHVGIRNSLRELNFDVVGATGSLCDGRRPPAAWSETALVVTPIWLCLPGATSTYLEVATLFTLLGPACCLVQWSAMVDTADEAQQWFARTFPGVCKAISSAYA